MNDLRADHEPVLEVKSDVYPGEDGTRWTLEVHDGTGRRAEGEAESTGAAYQEIRTQIEAWYPDDPITGEIKIVRLIR